MLLEDLNHYRSKRSTSGPLPEGSAPRVSSATFKLRQSKTKVKPRNWDHKLSFEGRQRLDSTLKASSQVGTVSPVISLGTARPAPLYYPWHSLSINTSDARRPPSELSASMTTSRCFKGEAAYDLGLALNYGYAAGSPQLLRFVTEHVEMMHSPPYGDWETALTCGTTSAIEILLRMLCDRGDTVLTEKFTYPGTIEAAKVLGITTRGIEMDHLGLMPNELDSVLRNWKPDDRPKPLVLYTVPSGQNPTGTSQSTCRREAIYEVATCHDLLILEDDPYYFVQLDGCADFESVTNSRQHYLDQLLPSYLSMDKCGRVLRLDATSKILSPGLRCGWITGCSQLVRKFIQHTELSTVAPSGPSQLLLYKLLDESWGHEGFVNWLAHLSLQFQLRLETLVRACERFLPNGLCWWTKPTAGMFLWITADICCHPVMRSGKGSANRNEAALRIEEEVYLAARVAGVIISKGSWFASTTNVVRDVHFRLSFAAASDEELCEAIKTLAGVFKQVFQLDNAASDGAFTVH